MKIDYVHEERSILSMIAGFTGTQMGMTEAQKKSVKILLEGATALIHGDCIGADADCHTIAMDMDLCISIYPSNLQHKRSRCQGAVYYHNELPPLERNKLIVDLCDYLIAAPKGYAEEIRSGTWSTVRYARNMKKKLLIVWPDGKIKTTIDINDNEFKRMYTNKFI